MTEEFETQDIDPVVYLEAYLSKAPAHIKDAWQDFKAEAQQNAQGAQASLEAYKSVREQNDRLLAIVGRNGAGV